MVEIPPPRFIPDGSRDGLASTHGLGANPKSEVPAPIENVESLKQYMALISDLNADGRQLWFRGARRSSYHLIPTLYRHPDIIDPNRLIELKWQLLSDFRHRAPPFVSSLPPTDLEMLFLMQHFGVPTRLLDWTENPLIALFFALENARESSAEDHDAAVWVVDPISLNQTALRHRHGSNKIFGGEAADLSGYLPSDDGRKVEMKWPIALYGIHNSPRIVAQRGGFVLFGKQTSGIDLDRELSEPPVMMRKFVIPQTTKRAIFKQLYSMGISDSVVYPDLDGLGRELKNRRGF